MSTSQLLSYFDKVMPEKSSTAKKVSKTTTKTTTKVGLDKKPSAWRGKKKLPQTPAALNAHQGWTVIDEDDFDPPSFEYQEHFLDELLSVRVINFVQNFRQRFSDKLKVNMLEPTEINVFSLLTTYALESALEYTN